VLFFVLRFSSVFPAMQEIIRLCLGNE